jgi:hypothetical protein
MEKIANESIKVMEDFIKDNPHWDEVAVAWYELKKIIYRKLKDNEQVRNRMIKYRQKNWTLCV